MPRDVELTFPPSEEPPEARSEAAWLALAAGRLGGRSERLAHARVVRVSFDARVRHRLWRVLVRVFAAGEPVPSGPPTTPPELARPRPDAPRVAIVGSGPAGLFCALDCLAAGLNVTVLERGRDVRARRKSLQLLNRGESVERDSNYCFGEGGAGTYSDGKLYARSGGKGEVRGVLETLVAHGAPEEILVSWRPHVGSNRLPEVVQALRATILRAGGSVRFRSRVEELERAPSGPPRIVALRVRSLEDDSLSREACDAVVLATGHSALDALLMAARAGARLEPKGFAMGARVEHAQAWLDQRQYGGLRGECDLPAAFYELAMQSEGRGVYSFCMCPGGFIVPATTAPERVVVNGMSLSRRDSPFANAGLVVQLEPEDWCGPIGDLWGFGELVAKARALGAELGGLASSDLPGAPEDDPLFGVRLQLALETVAAHLGGGAVRAPAQRADLVAADSREPVARAETSYRPGLTGADLAELFPPGMWQRLRAGLAEFEGRLPGFASAEGQLVGVESRTSSPVRVARDPETLASPTVAGLYPCGEGAGYAGGIVSAALDGRRVAAAIARTLAPG
ncbi:MAG TPA: NAD(P)/FAD-dependent oxidoreductase [Planctomycetota bacterium]